MTTTRSRWNPTDIMRFMPTPEIGPACRYSPDWSQAGEYWTEEGQHGAPAKGDHGVGRDSLDYVLGMLGHEMRSPINAIALSLELLRRAPAGREQGQSIESIERQLEVLTRLAEDLFLAARLPSAEEHLVMARIDLNEISRLALETCRGGIEDRRHRLFAHHESGPLAIEGDATRLRQVIVNLVDNAVKYTPPYGRIHVRTAREGNRAVLRIRDNGIGIPPEKLKRVFEPFVQVGDPRAPTRGIGLGLALVKKWVDLHGGSIKVHSDGADLGSEFVVRLPLLLESPAHSSGFIASMASTE